MKEIRKNTYEMHLHTRETGWCAQVWAKDIVDAYAKIGYQGICVTNHLFNEGMQAISKDGWEEKVDVWLEGYRAAKKQAEKYQDFDVILGAEIRLNQGDEEFLLYGITREAIIQSPEMFDFNIQQCFEFANDNNIVMIQAHPYRPYIKTRDIDHIHGLEVYNGNARHSNNNDKAYDLANRNSLIMLAGSDYHQLGDEGSAGMSFKNRVTNSIEMAKELKSNNGELYIDSSK